ncbi:MAG TPA: nucleotidyltransferase family protein [Puia sp.]|nr:nucleotidyltransferase family protein [Puia sp.]
MIKQAIILAGGLGTRLRSAVPELPKCMAPVAGKPFLSYVIDSLRQQGIEKFIFALGYKSEHFEELLRAEFPEGTSPAPNPETQGPFSSSSCLLSIESEPLGTGGAIKLACQQATEGTALVLNGDTFFGVRIDELAAFHEAQKAHCTLCLKPMENFDRYGVVELNPDHSIRHFREKQFYKAGLINGGVYALDTVRFQSASLPEKFSFEKDYLEKQEPGRRLFGLVQNGYFIDIGIPEDYARAQQELPAAIKPIFL